MALHEVRALDKNAARTAGRIINSSMVWLDYFDDELHERGGRIELAALLTFGQGELSEEVLVNPAEDIPIEVHRDLGKCLQKGEERVVAEAVVLLR
jgi:hypothetical protein